MSAEPVLYHANILWIISSGILGPSFIKTAKMKKCTAKNGDRRRAMCHGRAKRKFASFMGALDNKTRLSVCKHRTQKYSCSITSQGVDNNLSQTRALPFRGSKTALWLTLAGPWKVNSKLRSKHLTLTMLSFNIWSYQLVKILLFIAC